MLNFSPDTPLSDQIRVVENAVLVPWGRGEYKGMARPAGVFTAEGEYCANAITYRAANRPTTVMPEFPSADEVTDTIKGTVLFGGLAYGHFGHALCESTARLWAVDNFEDQIDSILFFPKKNVTWPERSLVQVKKILNSMGDLPPCTAINKPTRVERLVIASQGFGVNNMIGGAPEFRMFTDRRWGQRVQANGPEKLYISRSGLFSKRGRLLLEERIEEYLRTEGFTIFHPQAHDLETQLEHYKAAKVIVSTDNSALHLAAFVAGPDTKVAILLRRPGKIYLDFQEQLRRFAAIDPVISDNCERYWFREGEAVQLNEVISLMNFEKTAQSLAKAGIISNANWENPTKQDVDLALEDFEERGNVFLEEVFV
jgi:hypothetical protein